MEKEHIGTIVSQQACADGIFDLRVLLPDLCKQATCGQFVHVLCPDGFLRRPISICDIEGDVLRLVYRVQGKGTKSLSALNAGDSVSLLGPLGNGFTPVSGKTVILGGGIGVFPLVFLAKQLQNPTVFLGYANKCAVCLTEAFQNPVLYTDDGSLGQKGFVTEGLLSYLENEKPDMVYACGPAVMLEKIEEICKARDIRYQISFEERMGCGIGACLVCSCERDGQYKRVCKDGPVFAG